MYKHSYNTNQFYEHCAARTMKFSIENIVKIKSIKLIKGKCIEVSNNKYRESECAKIFKIRPHFWKIL